MSKSVDLWVNIKPETKTIQASNEAKSQENQGFSNAMEKVTQKDKLKESNADAPESEDQKRQVVAEKNKVLAEESSKETEINHSVEGKEESLIQISVRAK